jgi:hypothetical protein
MSSLGSGNLGVWRGPIATHAFAKRGKEEGRKRKMIGKRKRKGKEEERKRKGKGKGKEGKRKRIGKMNEKGLGKVSL